MSDAHPRIVMVGGSFIDLIGYAEHLPKPGETVIGNKFQQGFGGKGANQCVAAAKLGASTAIITKLGCDNYGKEYLQNYENLGVNVEYVARSNTYTGVALIMVDDNGENCIMVAPGSSAELSVEEVEKAENVISNAKVLVCQLELSWEVAKAAIKIARKHKVLTIMNLAPASNAVSKDDVSLFDVVIVNEVEMEAIIGRPVGGLDDAQEAVKDVIRAGAKVVILTLGSLGSVWTNCEDEAHYVPTDKVNVVDTTGAGDAFVGALAYYIAYRSTVDMRNAITFANKIASISVQKPGTQSSYPSIDDLPSNML